MARPSTLTLQAFPPTNQRIMLLDVRKRETELLGNENTYGVGGGSMSFRLSSPEDEADENVIVKKVPEDVKQMVAR